MSYELLNHQKDFRKFDNTRNYVANFSETGTGKTLMAIDTIKQKGFYKVLIICPLNAMEGTWEYEVEQHLTPLYKPIVIYDKDMDKRKEQLKQINAEDNPDIGGYIVIVNYDVLDKLNEEIMSIGYDAIFADESHYIARLSKRTKAAIKLADKANKYKCIMTGTPAATDLEQYWTQIRFLSEEVAGPSFHRWRQKHFHTGGFENRQWFPNVGTEELIMRVLKKFTFTALRDKCLDLPPRTITTIDVQMTKDQRYLYDSIEKDLMAIIDNEPITCPSAAAAIMKMRQVCAGFIYDESGEPTRWMSDAKLKILEEQLAMIPNKQCVIWYQFKEEARIISNMLGVQPYSMVPQNIRNDLIQLFKAGEIKYLLVHPASMGISVTLVNACDEFWFSLPYNTTHYLQARERIYRYGQKNSVHSRILSCPNSIDRLIQRSVQSKVKVQDAALKYFNQGGGAFK